MLAALPASAGSLTGIASVIDGDTLVVGNVTVRINEIDAAELGQEECDLTNGGDWACAEAAANRLAGLVGNVNVECETHGNESLWQDHRYVFRGRCRHFGQKLVGGRNRLGVREIRRHLSRPGGGRQGRRARHLARSLRSALGVPRRSLGAGRGRVSASRVPDKGNISAAATASTTRLVAWYGRTKIDERTESDGSATRQRRLGRVAGGAVQVAKSVCNGPVVEPA